MAHFRTMLSSENFSAADLWSEQSQKYGEIVVEIVKVSKGEVVGDKGRKKTMPMAQLRSAKNGQVIPKQLGLNATNCRTIASLAGSPNTEKWHGLWISLYVTKVDVGREMTDAIRIRPELAKPPVQAGKQQNTEPPKDEPAFDPTDVQPEDRQ
jgi:hypothetical protein